MGETNANSHHRPEDGGALKGALGLVVGPGRIGQAGSDGGGSSNPLEIFSVLSLGFPQSKP